MDRRNSSVWSYFTIVDNVYAKCDICKKDKSYKSSLTNLKKHLSSCHMIFLKHEQAVNKVSKLQINITLKQLNF